MIDRKRLQGLDEIKQHDFGCFIRMNRECCFIADRDSVTRREIDVVDAHAAS